MQDKCKKLKVKKIINIIIICLIVPALIFIGVFLFNDRKYNIISLLIALAACVPFFIIFEKKNTKTKELTVIAVMIALTVVGRLIFSPVPGFKPVTALIIITALCYGGEAGFLTGALSALVSNMFFGQGPWTPFQMFSWGIIGFLIGIFHNKNFIKSWLALIVEAIISGSLFSLLMDFWTVLNLDSSFNIARYITAVITSLPWMGVYVISNIIFLLVLYKPISLKLNRIKIKYMLFEE